MKNILLIILGLSTLLSYGQVDSLPYRTLDEIVVESQKEDIVEKNSSQKLSTKDLRVINAPNLGDAAKFFSGVLIKDYGGLGGVKTINVRGLSANHTAVLYDGVNVFDNQSGQVDLSKFSLGQVEAVELNLGTMSTKLLSASAIASASTMYIETKKPSQDALNLSYNFSSFNTHKADIYLAKQNSEHKTAYSLHTDLLTSKGNYPYIHHYGGANDFQTEKLYRQNNDILATHTELNYFWDIDKDNYLKIKAYNYYSDRGLPANVTPYYNKSEQRLYNDNAFMQATFTSYFQEKFVYKNNAKLDYNYTRYLDPLYMNAQGFEDDIYHQFLVYDNNAISYQPLENMFFSLSNDVYYNILHAPQCIEDTPERLSLLTALVGTWNWKQYFYISAHLLQSSYWDAYQKQTKATNKLSPYLSLSIKKGDFVSTIFYKDIFRMPTFNELYYRQVGDRNLKPEKTYQFSWNNQYHFDFKRCSFALEMNLYHNKVEDKIVAIPRNVFLWSMLNYGKVEINGADFKASIFMDLDHFDFDAKVNYSYQDAKDMDETSSTYGQTLPYTPKNVLSSLLEVELKNLTSKYLYRLGVNSIYVGKRYSLRENIDQNLLKQYLDIGLTLSCIRTLNDKGRKIILSLEVKNLLNQQYEVVKAYPMMGRYYGIKLEINK